MARAALRDDLHTVHAALTAQALAQPGGSASPAQDPVAVVAEWEHSVPGVPDLVRTLAATCSGPADLARVSVGLRVARGLLPTPA